MEDGKKYKEAYRKATEAKPHGGLVAQQVMARQGAWLVLLFPLCRQSYGRAAEQASTE